MGSYQYGASNAFGNAQLSSGINNIGNQNDLLYRAMVQSKTMMPCKAICLDPLMITSILVELRQTYNGKPLEIFMTANGPLDKAILTSNTNKPYADSRSMQPPEGCDLAIRPSRTVAGCWHRNFARNATNLESSIAGNQANALLQTPFAQQNQNLQALGQAQGSNLNILNAFSTPINQAFAKQGQQFQQGQFGAIYPSGLCWRTLTKPVRLLEWRGLCPTAGSLCGLIASPFQPSFASNFANQFGGTLGTSVGQGIGTALGMWPLAAVGSRVAVVLGHLLRLLANLDLTSKEPLCRSRHHKKTPLRKCSKIVNLR